MSARRGPNIGRNDIRKSYSYYSPLRNRNSSSYRKRSTAAATAGTRGHGRLTPRWPVEDGEIWLDMVIVLQGDLELWPGERLSMNVPILSCSWMRWLVEICG